MKRRILAFCLAALFLLAAPLCPSVSYADDAVPEDVSAARAARLLRASADIAPLCDADDAAKDVDGNGKFTWMDGVAVLRLLLFSETPPVLPAEPAAFIESAEVPLPTGIIASGQDCNLHGTVYSASPMTALTVSITRDKGGAVYPIETTVTFSAADAITSYHLESAEGTLEKESVTQRIDFSDLRMGDHTLTISLRSLDFPEGVTLSSTAFTVAEVTPLVLTQNKFRENYSTALQFFGYDTEKFLFTFKWSSGRNISTNANWREKNIVKSDFGRIHTDAVPYFNLARRYLDSTYLRISGGMHDSGVIRLSELLLTTSGPYVPRFVSERTYISHHSFGTAIDVNHKLAPNTNSKANWEVIRSEVQDNLNYNGIAADGNRRFYDFTYTGDWSSCQSGVPTSILNYLLYELAFFRAGFRWGYYYPHTCDGMHFSLTDSSLAAHSHLGSGLRKVFIYYN